MANSSIPLPPSIDGKVSDRNRNRVRVELSPTQGRWLAGLIDTALAKMDIDDEDFRATYLLHKSLMDQVNNIK